MRDKYGGVELHAAAGKSKHLSAGRLNRPSTDLFRPLRGSSQRTGNPICCQHGEAVSDAAVPKGRRDIWARPRCSGGSRVHPRLQPQEKRVL